jgi:membrane protease YdiL (CAAX protease family)
MLRWGRTHPVAAADGVVLLSVGLLLGLPRGFGHSIAPGHLRWLLSVLAFVLLFGMSLAGTWVAEGRVGAVRLLRSLVAWRVPVRWYVVAVVFLPVATIATAVATGTFVRGRQGWFALVVSYLLGTVVALALTNLWEESLWAGLVQRRLLLGRGPVVAAVLTSVPFALAHVPGAFQNVSLVEGATQVAVLAVLAPGLRYLASVMLLETGGSVLPVALLHASFNASGHIAAAHGGWQFLPALIILVVLVGCARRRGPGDRGARRAVATTVTATAEVSDLDCTH